MEQEPHILFEKRGALGLITLNRPKALNALTHGMCLGLAQTLPLWARDDAIQAVAIRGAGERAFCAGGEIRAMYESHVAGTKAAAKFLAVEYCINALIGASRPDARHRDGRRGRGLDPRFAPPGG